LNQLLILSASPDDLSELIAKQNQESEFNDNSEIEDTNESVDEADQEIQKW
jgi:hypothetical protein